MNRLQEKKMTCKIEGKEEEKQQQQRKMLEGIR